MSGPHYLLLKLGQFWELKVVSIRHCTREIILQGHKMTLINKRGTAGPRPEGQRKLVEKVHLSERGEKGQISSRTQRPLGRSSLACGRKTDCWALCGCCVISQDSCAVSGRRASWALATSTLPYSCNCGPRVCFQALFSILICSLWNTWTVS